MKNFIKNQKILLSIIALLLLIAPFTSNGIIYKDYIIENIEENRIKRNHINDYSYKVTQDVRVSDGASPYVLLTEYNELITVDFGTFKEIDSLKCIRYQEMTKYKDYIYLNCALQQHISFLATDKVLDKTSKELELLNKPCKN